MSRADNIVYLKPKNMQRAAVPTPEEFLRKTIEHLKSENEQNMQMHNKLMKLYKKEGQKGLPLEFEAIDKEFGLDSKEINDLNRLRRQIVDFGIVCSKVVEAIDSVLY